MSCKTTAYRILADTLTALAEEEENSRSSSPEYRAIYKVINPKSITMNQVLALTPLILSVHFLCKTGDNEINYE